MKTILNLRMFKYLKNYLLSVHLKTSHKLAIKEQLTRMNRAIAFRFNLCDKMKLRVSGTNLYFYYNDNQITN